LKAVLKSSVLILIYWLLWGQIASFQNWLLVLALCIPIGLFWIGVGFIIGIRQTDMNIGGQVLAEIVIPSLAISGLLYPVAYYPPVIEQITYYLPMTLGFYLSRTFFGIGVQETWMIAALAGWGLVSILIAYRFLRGKNYE
jgi:ABC-type polysaccharide/polyol phosphate export permease